MTLMGLVTKAIRIVQKSVKKQTTHGSPCSNCTILHTPGREHCPAKDSNCHAYQNAGHWKQKCRKKSNKAKDVNKKPKSQFHCQSGGRKRAGEVGVSEADPAFDEITIHA